VKSINQRFHERYDMKKLLTAIALTIAIPAVANAQAAPAPAPKAEQAHACPMDHKKMAGMDHSKMDHSKMAGMDHSKMAGMDHSKMDMKAGANCHAGHDMSQPAAKTPQADPHSNHQQ
jgi:uncharacterized protein involved in copper resistance